MREAVVVDVVRTPFGRGRDGGALAGEHPVDLLALVLREAVQRTGIDPATVDDVIAGCVLQVGEQSGNVARSAALAAAFPDTVPGVTIDRKCGSAQQALHFAAQGIIAGAYDIVLACGVESMSTVPMRANRIGRDALGPRLHERFPQGLVNQGISAELIAARWRLSREELDGYALRSHQWAAEAERAGWLEERIVPVTRRDGRVVTRDEGIRPDTSAERLASLPPAFRDATLAQRYPEIGWVVTAGNASQITDGASATVVMAAEVAERLGLRPRAVLRGFSVVGSDPILMLTGVIPATQRLLARTGVSIADIDVFEVNEAFASVVLAWAAELNVPLDDVNVWGGAIAFGHPVGASGGRLLANLLDVLQVRGGRYGLLTMCESGGMANATLLERLG